MTGKQRKIFVTSALPYAKRFDPHRPPAGGHTDGHLGAFPKIAGPRLPVSLRRRRPMATPIMLKAQQEGIAPEALIERVRAEQQRDYAAFGIGFDNFHTTHSEENRVFAESIYAPSEGRGAHQAPRCQAILRPRSRRCSCRIVSSAASVLSAAPRGSTATVARVATAPTSPRI